MTMALGGGRVSIFGLFEDFWPYKEAVLKRRSSLAEEHYGSGD
jgi:hypothetical protein